MPIEITRHSNFYPSGGLILFNSRNYFLNKISDRIAKFYNENAFYLKYAEQEILCAVIDDLEFFNFEGNEYVYLDDLSNYVTGNYSPIDQNKLNNSIFYKNQGSIKPWKKWNLNPNKAIYLKYRNYGSSKMRVLHIFDSLFKLIKLSLRIKSYIKKY